MNKVFKVKYISAWENEDITDTITVNVVAKDAEKAISKAKSINKGETYKDDETKKTYHRDTFELLEVELVCDLDE